MQEWDGRLSREFFKEFQSRGVIITGVGTGNIGAALADGFHWLGAKVALLGYDEAALKALVSALAGRTGHGRTAPFMHAGDLSIEENWQYALNKASLQSARQSAVWLTTGAWYRTKWHRANWNGFIASISLRLS